MTALPPSAATLELRPRRSPILRREDLRNDSARMLFVACGVAYLLVKLVMALATGGGGEFFGGIGVAVVLLSVFFVMFRRMRLRVAPGGIDRIGGLPAKHVDRAEVIGVVRVPIESFRMQEGFVDLLVNRQGHCLLRMRERVWEHGDLDRAWAHAGLGIQHVTQTMNYKQLEDWIPGSTKLWERRPIAFANAITIVLITALVLLMSTAP